MMISSKDLKVGILYESKEDILTGAYKASLESYLYHWREPEEITAVKETLEGLGCNVTLLGCLESQIPLEILKSQDLVWNLSVGVISKNRTSIAPAYFELNKIPYTGADAKLKNLTQNKDILKPFLQSIDIQTPPWVIYRESINTLPAFKPAVLKPACEGNSIGLFKVEADTINETIIEHIHSVQQNLNCPVLWEEFIFGREITVSYIKGLPAMGFLETLKGQNQILGESVISLESKRKGMLVKSSVEKSDPLREALQVEVEKFASYYPDLDYASFDFRISHKNTPFLIDINCDATLHPKKAMAASFAFEGIEYSHMIQSILDINLHRWLGAIPQHD